ncbi:hypothetical protein HN51_026899 [Arachis hypogaea]|nr:uncharacterized protein DS421_9g255730 [Arachis hypogaea]
MAKLTIAKKLFLLLLVSGVLMTIQVIGDKRCEDVWYDESCKDGNSYYCTLECINKYGFTAGADCRDSSCTCSHKCLSY